MLVAEIAEWNFNLVVYFTKKADKASRHIEMNSIHPINLSEIEDYLTLKLTHKNSL